MALSCQCSSNKNFIKNSTWWHVLLSVLSTKTWYEALCLVTSPCPFSVNKAFVGNTASCKIPSNVVSTNTSFKHTASWRVLVNITTKLVSRGSVTRSCQCFKHTIHDTFKSALYHSLCQTYTLNHITSRHFLIHRCLTDELRGGHKEAEWFTIDTLSGFPRNVWSSKTRRYTQPALHSSRGPQTDARWHAHVDSLTPLTRSLPKVLSTWVATGRDNPAHPHCCLNSPITPLAG